jgi:hypothetical protein
MHEEGFSRKAIFHQKIVSPLSYDSVIPVLVRKSASVRGVRTGTQIL